MKDDVLRKITLMIFDSLERCYQELWLKEKKILKGKKKDIRKTSLLSVQEHGQLIRPSNLLPVSTGSA